MSVLIASTTSAAQSNTILVTSNITLIASSGIASGEDCSIQIDTDTEGWRDTGEVLTSDVPAVMIIAPGSYRLSKPVSASAYGVEGRITDRNW